ncbi:hypothetical protein NEOLEDRAFT_895598 [Neolentinus lepideus HHB14362 ss-1]|uniref:Uncharacterized protein n=1 Tax=Neolentinus lepideus HHB14362 ss-1 TaxID=1314782 RepID=A0A165NQP4_9AGAM|nr:hypothetical protein NEOLEDRAFT_895598 [Neolentinus lepideus HHB14362 ss-1]
MAPVNQILFCVPHQNRYLCARGDGSILSARSGVRWRQIRLSTMSHIIAFLNPTLHKFVAPNLTQLEFFMDFEDGRRPLGSPIIVAAAKAVPGWSDVLRTYIYHGAGELDAISLLLLSVDSRIAIAEGILPLASLALGCQRSGNASILGPI